MSRGKEQVHSLVFMCVFHLGNEKEEEWRGARSELWCLHFVFSPREKGRKGGREGLLGKDKY